MASKPKMPCRVCGKLFEPCAYCKSHADVFRWRNFACSRECAKKYIEEATAYRESLRVDREKKSELSGDKKSATDIAATEKNTTTRKKTNKKTSEDITIENKTEEKETE